MVGCPGLEDVPHLLRKMSVLMCMPVPAWVLAWRWPRVALHRLDVHVQLVVQAALQLAALAGQLHRVQGQLLVAGGAGGHAAEVGEQVLQHRFAAAVADAPPSPASRAPMASSPP